MGASKVRREDEDEEHDRDEESRGLLTPAKGFNAQRDHAALDDRGISPRDIFTAISDIKIWHILACNILSAIPVTAFSVFLPLVLAPLTNGSNPALVNLLTAPPHLCGATALFVTANYSDKYRLRLLPILCGLSIVVIGLVAVVALPPAWAIPRYLALNVLLSGSYIASPLTVAWLSGNTPSPGKRAMLMGINGWGNFAGIIAAVLYRPKYASTGYIVPFWWTLVFVAVAAFGFVLFYRNLQAENARRRAILSRWSEEAIELEIAGGSGPLAQEFPWAKRCINLLGKRDYTAWLAGWLKDATQGGREGDEKMTFTYGL